MKRNKQFYRDKELRAKYREIKAIWDKHGPRPREDNDWNKLQVLFDWMDQNNGWVRLQGKNKDDWFAPPPPPKFDPDAFDPENPRSGHREAPGAIIDSATGEVTPKSS